MTSGSSFSLWDEEYIPQEDEGGYKKPLPLRSFASHLRQRGDLAVEFIFV